MKRFCITATLLLAGCGSGLTGLQYNGSSQNGGVSISLVQMFIGSNASVGFSDSLVTSQSGYQNISNGWTATPTGDPNDLVGYNNSGFPVSNLFASTSSSTFARVDFIFDALAGGANGNTLGGLYFVINGQGGCSTNAAGETLGISSLTSGGGNWNIGWWDPSAGHWNSISPPSVNTVTPIVASNASAISKSAAITSLNGLSGSGSYYIFSVRASNVSCGSATGVLVQSVSLSSQ